MQTFAGWVLLPENRSARAAVGRLAKAVRHHRVKRPYNPLFLNGPAGTGKTHLIHALLAHVSHHHPEKAVVILAAREFRTNPGVSTPDSLSDADLVVIEDLQHLPATAVEALVHLVDRCRARGRQLVVTATAGPAQLDHLPGRLSTRLSAGLVVRLHLLSPGSRRVFLRDRVERRGMNIAPDIVDWLAKHLPGSGRQLEGAVARMAALTRVLDRPLTPDILAENFRDDLEAHRLTVEFIAQRVGRYFRVAPDQLQSRSQGHQSLVPRQVGMYLARRLTPLSLQEIGAYFGGRDHSTVLHACRKVEEALTRDAALSGAVRHLQADLE